MSQWSGSSTLNNGQFFQVEGDYRHYNVHIYPPSSDLVTESVCTSQSFGDQAAIKQYNDLQRQTALKQLYAYIAPGALHNSEERHDSPKCHPETRKAVQQAIMNWAKNSGSNARLLMWLHGPAGAGKSAIMQTIAEICQQEGILGASFFFFRSSPKRNVKTHLVTTIAYQLSQAIPHFADCITEAILSDPAIFDKTLPEQMRALVIVPFFTAANIDLKSWVWKTYLILIDGLDECGPENSHKEIISLLSTLNSYSLRFLIASRPEFVIRTTFSLPYVHNDTKILALDDTYNPNADIRIFLLAEFDNIKARHPSGPSIPSTWPSYDDVRTLVKAASGQFIYAATVLKFLASPRHNPLQRFDMVLMRLSTTEALSPFAQLDALYHQIFASVEDLTRVLHIIQYINYMPKGYIKPYPSHIDLFFGYSFGETRVILCDMHSLLGVPTDDSQEIQPHHASLGDFLLDPIRSKHLYCEPADIYAFLSLRVILGCKETNFYNDLNLSMTRIFILLQTMLPKAVLTDELAEALISTDIYEKVYNVISLLQFPTAKLYAGDIVDALDALDAFFVLFATFKVREPQTLRARIFDHLLEKLDMWLVDILKEWHISKAGTTNWAILLASFSMVHRAPEKTHHLFRQYIGNLTRYGWRSDGFVDAIMTVSSTPCRQMHTLLTSGTQGLFDNLGAHHITILLTHIPWLTEFVWFDECHSLWARQLCQLLPMVGAMPNAGMILAKFVVTDTKYKAAYLTQGKPQQAYGSRGQCMDDLCIHGYTELKHLKMDLYSLAVVVSEYLQKCGIELDRHAYSPKHYVCFSCQSTETFLKDPEFGTDFQLWYL